MAIKKAIKLDNGIITEYHRIALVNIDVNSQNTILIYSYLNEDGRQIEKDYAAGKYNDVEIGTMKFPYFNAKYINVEYTDDMTVKKAYAYIKTLPQFEGGIDV